MREISGETTMFSLIRRKPTTLTKVQGNPKARLNKKEKQKLVKAIQQLESDINFVTNNLEKSERDYEKSQQSLEHAPEDLKKIQYCIEKEWYTTCQEICSSHGWRDGYHAFSQAEGHKQNHSLNRRHRDAAARGVICIERQLREDKRELATVSKKIKVLANKKQTLEQKLVLLKQ